MKKQHIHVIEQTLYGDLFQIYIQDAVPDSIFDETVEYVHMILEEALYEDSEN